MREDKGRILRFITSKETGLYKRCHIQMPSVCKIVVFLLNFWEKDFTL